MNIPDDATKLSWDEVYRQSLLLAKLISAHCDHTGEKYDSMVVVPRGAYYPANIISRELNFGATDLLQASIESYQGGSKNKFKLGQMPDAEQVKDKALLVIDEICDSGKTLAYLEKYLYNAGAKVVRTGVIHYKQSLSNTGFQPDWVVEKTNKWIVYPWEIHDKT